MDTELAVAHRPVRRQAPRAQRQHPRAQVRHAPARQDQKAAVVGEQVLATDPAVAGAALQRRRREAGQRHPFAAPARGVPQRLADLRQRAQVVVRPHQALVASFVLRRHRLDGNLAQLHAVVRALSTCRLLYSYSERMSSIRVNPFFPLGFPGCTNSSCPGTRHALTFWYG